MPRIARKDLSSTFIHVMVQGINRKNIYEENVEICLTIFLAKNK